ncbi:type VI secretion protein [Pseudomonas citrulli]|uniref:Type VI secretion protein n=1 Tax=Pseudomonas citrulli TaxID=3064347 RepID=A0ABT9BVW6_9PSED|nr:type VI secretion protein [Pseudomonas sp. K18]MDO7896642.1 type VI secretion protein [Pseudomonas sp. K18]
MPVFSWPAVLLSCVVSCSLVGCNGNYKFNDSGYRPLGDPQAITRGK